MNKERHLFKGDSVFRTQEPGIETWTDRIGCEDGCCSLTVRNIIYPLGEYSSLGAYIVTGALTSHGVECLTVSGFVRDTELPVFEDSIRSSDSKDSHDFKRAVQQLARIAEIRTREAAITLRFKRQE
jgi:hypothetical protein